MPSIIKPLLAIIAGVTTTILIISCSQVSPDKAKADPEIPYRMTYQRTGIGGVARYENQETVCYTFDQSQKGGISCMPKSKDGSLSTY